MPRTSSRTRLRSAPAKRLDLRIPPAFFAIYILWGTTFLAIRIAVREMPPLLAAGSRFFLAGIALYSVLRVKGASPPTAPQWRNLLLLATLMFVAEYGPLFWAEKYVSSGIASVLAATIPLVTLICEWVVFRGQPLRWSLIPSTLLGFGGVVTLLSNNPSQHIPTLPCLAILGGVVTWSLGSVLNRKLDLPRSRPLNSGATMMLGGALLLALSAAFGELHPLPHISLKGILAVVYLIVFGSLLAYTAFVWLLSRMPASSVSSYAYINPIVAVALGCLVAGETVTLRTLVGAALIVVAVILILRPTKKPAPSPS